MRVCKFSSSSLKQFYTGIFKDGPVKCVAAVCVCAPCSQEIALGWEGIGVALTVSYALPALWFLPELPSTPCKSPAGPNHKCWCAPVHVFECLTHTYEMLQRFYPLLKLLGLATPKTGALYKNVSKNNAVQISWIHFHSQYKVNISGVASKTLDCFDIFTTFDCECNMTMRVANHCACFYWK